MKSISIVLMTVALWFKSALAADSLGRVTNFIDLSPHPQTTQFVALMASQTNGASQLAQSNLLVITSFFDSGTNYCRCEVTQGSGWGHTLANCREWCKWCPSTYVSTKYDDEVKRLRAAIAALPAHNDSPPLDRLVLVSFATGTNWTTRTYDRKSLPDALLTVCRIMGDGFELRDKDKITRAHEMHWP